MPVRQVSVGGWPCRRGCGRRAGSMPAGRSMVHGLPSSKARPPPAMAGRGHATKRTAWPQAPLQPPALRADTPSAGGGAARTPWGPFIPPGPPSARRHRPSGACSPRSRDGGGGWPL